MLMFQTESIDSSERLTKQFQDESILLREDFRDKNKMFNTIKCVIDQLSKRDGTACSSTERPSYRKSANDSIFLKNEKKTHNNSGKIHTDEENLLNTNVLLNEESTEPSSIT